MEEIECSEVTIPEIDTNEIFIDPKKVINIISHQRLIEQCMDCSNINNLEIVHDIQHAFKIAEIKFSNICHEIKLSEKLIKILNAECFLQTFHCADLRMHLLKITAHEFIKA